MTFPVPPDARAGRDFEIVLGGDELIRQSFAVYDLVDTWDEGEWGYPVMDSGVEKMEKVALGVVVAAPAVGARCVWTKYRQGDSNAGQADAMGTGQVEAITGPYQAKTRLYAAGTYTPGWPLVVISDAVTNRGVLVSIDPAAVTLLQTSCIVGKVIGETGGVLHYESR